MSSGVSRLWWSISRRVKRRSLTSPFPGRSVWRRARGRPWSGKSANRSESSPLTEMPSNAPRSSRLFWAPHLNWHFSCTPPSRRNTCSLQDVRMSEGFILLSLYVVIFGATPLLHPDFFFFFNSWRGSNTSKTDEIMQCLEVDRSLRLSFTKKK